MVKLWTPLSSSFCSFNFARSSRVPVNFRRARTPRVSGLTTSGENLGGHFPRDRHRSERREICWQLASTRELDAIYSQPSQIFLSPCTCEFFPTLRIVEFAFFSSGARNGCTCARVVACYSASRGWFTTSDEWQKQLAILWHVSCVFPHQARKWTDSSDLGKFPSFTSICSTR